MQEHVKLMTKICEELSVIGEAISEEDRVVNRLGSLPESYNVLVTAPEASVNVPTLAVVRERLLHEETKMKSKSNQLSQEGALTTRNYDAIFVISLGILRKTVKSLQKSKAKPNQPKLGRRTKWGHSRLPSVLRMRVVLTVKVLV